MLQRKRFLFRAILLVIPCFIVCYMIVNVDYHCNCPTGSENRSENTSTSPAAPFDYLMGHVLLNFVERNYEPQSIRVKELAEVMHIMTRIRLDLQPWTSSGKHKSPPVFDVHVNFMQRLQKAELRLYPFLNGKYNTVEAWIASYSGRGIVISAGSSHLRYVVYLLKNLKVVGCDLPVELVTEDASQLSTEHQTMLTSMGTRLIYLNEKMDNRNSLFASYGMKLAAMLVSSFREAILIDCDDVFLRNPQLLFDDVGYKATGTLYFYEQPHFLNSFGNRYWLQATLPKPLSERVRKSNMFKGHHREVDSAVVVMDKVRCFYGLLAAARLNLPRERDLLYKIFWGDAELWWIGFEMAGVPYSISPFAPGGIGPVKGNEVCGKNMHFGNDGRPFFWNQGFVKSKNENNPELMQFEAFTDNGIIVFYSPTVYCVKGTGPVMLNRTEKKLINELKNLWLNTTGFKHW